MGLLSEVMQIKQNEAQRRNADLMAIPQALNTFLAASQNREKMDLEARKVDIDKMVAEAQVKNVNSLIEDRPLQRDLEGKRIAISEKGNALQERGQNIDLAKTGLKEQGGAFVEDPNTLAYKSALAEIEQKKAQQVIANIMRGQQLESAGVDMQKQALEIEDQDLYDRGEALKNMGRNIATATATPPDQKVNGYLSPQVAAITPDVPIVPLAPVQSKEKKDVVAIKAEREQRKLDAEIKSIKEKEKAKGIPADKAGIYALADESMKNIDNVITTLFPDGTPESYQRGVAFASNAPHLDLPGGLSLGPRSYPTEKGQDVRRWMTSAVAGRQLIQTGVAARPEETERLVSNYAPSGTSNYKSTFKGLKELKDFYKKFKEVIDTKGLEEAKKEYPGAEEFLKQHNTASVSGGFDENKRARLEELRKKKAEGTLGK